MEKPVYRIMWTRLPMFYSVFYLARFAALNTAAKNELNQRLAASQKYLNIN